MAHRIKIIGLLRFSVLTPTYYSERFDTLDAIAEHIYSPERMALRFHLFENLCLPSLAHQSDRDFDCVILTGERLPAEHRTRLEDLLAPYPHLHLRAAGTEKHYALLKDGYNSIDLGPASHKALFRLDDDDAVDLDGDGVADVSRGVRACTQSSVPIRAEPHQTEPNRTQLYTVNAYLPFARA